MNEITVLLPAYNEEECLKTLVENWQRYRNELQNQFGMSLYIVIINDGSKDRTEEIARQLENEYDNVILVNHPQNRGLGAAVKTGITFAIQNRKNSRFCCLMDCDNTHDPCYIFDMLSREKSTGADVVIASRYQQGAEVLGVSKLRLLMSEGAKFVYSIVLNVENVRDYTCGYRLYRMEMLKKAYERFGDQLIEEMGFTCMAELLYKLSVCGAVFAEIPFALRYDFKEGASKMRVMKTALNSLRLAFRLKGIR